MDGGSVNQDLGVLLQGIAELQTDAEQLLTDSDYRYSEERLGKFQDVNSQSTGAAVAKISYLDAITNSSLKNWKRVTDNLKRFVENDVKAMWDADAGGI